MDVATIGIGMETSGLKEGQKELEKTAQAAEKTADAATKVGQQSATAGAGLRGLGKDSREAADGLSAADRKALSFIDSLQKQLDIYGKSNSEIRRYTAASIEMTEAQRKQTDALLKQNEALDLGTKIGNAAKVAFLAFTAAAVAGATAAYLAFDNLVKKAGEFQDLAEKTGDTAQNMASLAVAAAVGGVSMQQVSQSAIMLSKNLTGVDDESKAAGAAVAALGLNLQDFKNLSPADRIEAVAKAMNGFEDGTAKSSVAMALMGRSGAQLLPFLKELGEEGGRQVILTNEQIKQADDYADKQTKLRTELSLHAQAIATELLPVYTAFTGTLVDAAKEIGGLNKEANTLTANEGLKNFAETLAKGLAVVADTAFFVAQSFIAVGKAYGGALAAFKTSMTDFTGANKILNMVRTDIDAMSFNLGLAEKLEARFAAMRAKKGDSGDGKNPSDRPELVFDGAIKPKRSAATASAYDSLENSISQQITLAQEELAMGEKLNAADKMRVQLIGKVTAAYADGKISLEQWSNLYDKSIKAVDARALTDNTNAYLRNVTALKLNNAELENEIETGQTLSAAQKNAVKILADVTNGTRKYTEAEIIAQGVLLNRNIILERINAQRKAQISADERALDGLDKEVAGLRDSNEALALKNQEIGLSQRALDALTLKRQDEAIAIQQSIVLESADAVARGDGTAAMVLQIKKLDELQRKRGLTVAGQAGTDTANDFKKFEDAAKKSEDAWIASAKSIEDALYNASANGFGSGIKKAFGDIKQWLARQFLSFAVRPFAEFGASLLNPGAASALGGAGGAGGLGSLGGLSNLASSGKSLAGYFGFGAAAPVASASAAGAAGVPISAILGESGYATAAGAGTALGGSTAVAGGGALAGAAAAVPYVAIALAIIAILDSNKTQSSKNSGESYSFFDASGATTRKTDFSSDPMLGNATNPAAGNATADKVVAALQAGYAAQAKALGISTVSTAFSYGGTTGKQGEEPRFYLNSQAGDKNYNLTDEKVTDAALALASSRAILSALQGSTLPKYLAGVFDGITAGAATQEQIGIAIATAQAFKGLHDQLQALPFAALKDLTYAAYKGLSDYSGGLANLTANLAAYYDKFIPQAEKTSGLTASVSKVFAELGLTMPALDANAHAAFRTLVEGQDASTAAGQRNIAALLGVSGAFDQLSNAASTASDQFVAFVDNVMKLVDGIHKSVGDSIFNMRYATQDTQGKYGLLDQQAKGYDDKMRASTDINEIAKLAQLQIDTINKAFGLLDPQQQKATLAQNELLLTKVDSFVSQSGADAISLKKSENQAQADATAAAVAVAVAKALEDLAVKMTNAAIAQAAAAATIAAVIKEPAQVNVSVFKTPGVEVSVDTTDLRR